MTLLDTGDECEIDDTVCCNTLYDIAEHILDTVHTAILVCTPTPPGCAPLLKYVTLGDGDDMIVDALTVAYQGIGTIEDVQATVTVYSVDYKVLLRESGWPTATVDGTVIRPPDPAIQNALARQVYSHMETMMRKLRWMAQAGHRRMAPVGTSYVRARLSNMTPLPPQAGVVGADITVTVEFG